MLSQICLFFSVTKLKSPSGETFILLLLEESWSEHHQFIFPGSDFTGERYLYCVCVMVVLRASWSEEPRLWTQESSKLQPQEIFGNWERGTNLPALPAFPSSFFVCSPGQP